MNRRGFLSGVIAAGVTATIDPERLLWVPGRKTVFIPPAIVKPDRIKLMSIGHVRHLYFENDSFGNCKRLHVELVGPVNSERLKRLMCPGKEIEIDIHKFNSGKDAFEPLRIRPIGGVITEDFLYWDHPVMTAEVIGAPWDLSVEVSGST